MILVGKNSLLMLLERVGTENLTFFAPIGTRFSRCHFRAQKGLDFQDPPLPMALEMDLPASNHYVPRHINNRARIFKRF